MPKQLINLTVNGSPYEVAVEPRWTLLEMVRETVEAPPAAGTPSALYA